MTYGGTVVSLTAPDRGGKFADVVLAPTAWRVTQATTTSAPPSAGTATASGTLLQARWQAYTLPKNDGDNTLHGGPEGFDKRVWKATAVSTAEGQSSS